MRLRRSHLLVLVLALPIVSFAPCAGASDSAAAEAFKAGAGAYQRGDYRAAAASFERAYKESPRSAAIYNAGLAWEAAGEGPRAADAYAAALDSGDLGAQQKKDAQTRFAGLSKTLGRVDVTGPPGSAITVEHRDSASVPAKVYLSPGAHEITASFSDGASVKQQVSITAGATTALALEAPKKEAPAPPPPPRFERRDAPPPPPAPGIHPRKVVGFVALGGAAIATGAAVYLGVSAVSAKDDFDASGHRDQNAHDSADSLRTMTNVAWIAAGVLAATGIVLVVTAPKSTSPASTTATFGPAGGTVTVRF